MSRPTSRTRRKLNICLVRFICKYKTIVDSNREFSRLLEFTEFVFDLSAVTGKKCCGIGAWFATQPFVDHVGFFWAHVVYDAHQPSGHSIS